jgi:hypothetical protein
VSDHFPEFDLENDMVQAWVARKTLKRNILRVFSMSDLINMLRRLLVKTHHRKRVFVLFAVALAAARAIRSK